ncbi:MAG: SEC-C domain-containing protein [Phycisphaerales bacterium]|nr:MAG: SEC-C domain-containing protein [Phycisphaerales bacterium]
MGKSRDQGEDRYKRREDREKAYKDQLPGVDDEPLPPPVETIHADDKPQRNDPCPCGSGKKYKKCCGKQGG